MEERINKPRVFLSHSKKNIDFIENLADDLRKCHIEPWLDTDQIRHGKSWQDSIFELGLPTCDAIIVYFTEISINSPVVKKEMDVGLLQNLKNSNIAFLPYVNSEKLRAELRPDIQALQVPEWNEKNYHLLLPRVVSEIWRSYLENTVSSAIKDERLKRIEAELELQKYRNQPEEIFSVAENREFEFISSTFDTEVSAILRINWNAEVTDKDQVDERLGGYIINLDLSSIVARLSDYFTSDYLRKELHEKLYKEIISNDAIPDTDETLEVRILKFPDLSELTDQLLTSGLIERYNYTSYIDGSEYIESRMMLSKKYYRFRFWLAYHKKLPNQLCCKLMQRFN